MLIQKMRDGSEGILAKIIIGLIIIVFALFGFGSITTFLTPTPKVAVVNGEEISEFKMLRTVERNRRLQMAQNPSQPIDEDALRTQVLQSLIDRELLTQATTELDLYYSDAKLDAELVINPAFQIDGAFSADQYRNVINSMGYQPVEFRDEIRTEKLFEQLASGIGESAFLTSEESQRYNMLLGQKRDIGYLTIKVDELLDEIEVTDDDIANYYAENTQDFVTDETVSLQYLELNRADLAAAYEVVEEELAEYFNQRIGEWSTDESRQFAHILVELNDERSADAAKARADEVYQKILNGEDFSGLASEYSDDLGSSEFGGDLGFNPQGTFLPEFEAVGYDLGMNEVSEPVLTEQGYHIIKLTGLEEAYVPELADVRAEVEAQYRLHQTEETFIDQSSQLADLLYEAQFELETPATELGLEIKTTAQLARDAAHFLMSNIDVREAAFSADVLTDGNNSDVVTLADGHVVGLRVLEHVPSATQPLDEVREDIRYIVQRTQAQDLATSRAKEIEERITSGSLAQFVAGEFNLEWQVALEADRRRADLDPQLLQEAFRLPRPAESKESLGTTTLPNGDGVVLRVSRVIDPVASEDEAALVSLLQNQLGRQVGAVDMREYQATLESEAEIDR